MRQAMTSAEFKLWTKLRNRQLGGVRFRRQVPLGPFIVDFYCPERKLVVEVDGSQHFSPVQQAADSRRDAWLRRSGNTVLRFANRDVVSNLAGVCDAILSVASRDREEYPSPKPTVPVSALPQGEG
jgi:very-short-patch-repair endonuclease